MDILKSWKNSLELFKPGNLKLFGLVTLNAYYQLWKVILVNWWVIVGLAIIVHIAVPFLLLPFITNWSLYKAKILLYKSLMANLLLISFCLATRASVNRKTLSYFFKYVFKFWYMLPIYYLLVDFLFLPIWPTNFFVVYILPFIWSFILIAKIICLLFMFDSDTHYPFIGTAIKHMMHFIIYNFPLCLLLSFLIVGEQFFWKFLFHTIYFVYWLWFFELLRAVFFLSFLIVILTNLYTKQIHDQSKYYFPQPS